MGLALSWSLYVCVDLWLSVSLQASLREEQLFFFFSLPSTNFPQRPSAPPPLSRCRLIHIWEHKPHLFLYLCWTIMYHQSLMYRCTVSCSDWNLNFSFKGKIYGQKPHFVWRAWITHWSCNKNWVSDSHKSRRLAWSCLNKFIFGNIFCEILVILRRFCNEPNESVMWKELDLHSWNYCI